MSSILLIQSSLSQDSKTAVVVKEAAKNLKQRGIPHEILDLRKIELEFCDGRSLSDYNDDLQEAFCKIETARALIFGMPVYCFSVSGVLKNFIDITAEAMENQVAGILCNAGGKGSYMSLGDLSKILAFESRVITVQPTVYTTYEDFKDGKLKSKAIKDRIDLMLDTLLHFTEEDDE